MDRKDMEKITNERKKVAQERAQLYSKKRLIGVLTTKFKTSMIGALASVEKYFGHLWDNRNIEDLVNGVELSADVKNNLEAWQSIRNEILDRGNNQLRAAIDEVANYTFNWNKYQVKLMIRKGNQE